MSALDDIFDHYDDEDGEEGYGRCEVKTCNRCGERGLHWEKDGKGWYLADLEGYEHECAEEALHKKVSDSFDALDA